MHSDNSSEAQPVDVRLDPATDLVAYFCMEFGLHQGLKLYSGGMGILAGDHLKAASDYRVPLVAVGLLYHQGYFDQTIDREGQQEHSYVQANFAELPLTPAVALDGKPLRVSVELPGRAVALNVWKVRAHGISLFLLDSDVPENERTDREITYQLYGGGRRHRLEQEIVLGIGGVRALRTMGLAPTVWHSNEGHSAFQILERCREHVGRGTDFDTALEVVASNTVFTTHTPVPAGHDVFERDLMVEYFADMARDLGIEVEDFLRLGAGTNGEDKFNMTALALRGSRFQNGVSRIHRNVAARLDAYIWGDVPPAENPVTYVTNGVHAGTFLAPTWDDVFHRHLGADWREQLCNADFWRAIEELPDSLVWNVRKLLKQEALGVVRARALKRFHRIGKGPGSIARQTQWIDPAETGVLTIAWARRFATYKRAALVLSDAERLARLVNDARRPVVLLFAGKAHPRDLFGQQTIRTIHDMSQWPEFEGKILLLEGYDLPLAKAMLLGVDVWLNTPQYPLEASGTSGMKAGMNGTLNLSVLDGWWAEGFNTRNGWGIFPHADIDDPGERDQREVEELYTLLEEQVVPSFYERDEAGIPVPWVAMIKASMHSIIPRFSALRMLQEYSAQRYVPAAGHGRRLRQQGNAAAHELASWKRTLARAWPGVGIRRLGKQPGVANGSPSPPSKVAVKLAGLSVDEVVVECVWGTDFDGPGFNIREKRAYRPVEGGTEGETVYELEFESGFAASELARYAHRVRICPRNELLAHPAETGHMRWL